MIEAPIIANTGIPKFILKPKENTEVFSFCDEFGNYFNKNMKKV